MQIKVTCKVIGLREYRFVDAHDDTEYETVHEENQIDTIVFKVIDVDGKEAYRYKDRFGEFSFWNYYGLCGSGYCMSSWGGCRSKWIERPGVLSAVPIQRDLSFKAVVDTELNVLFDLGILEDVPVTELVSTDGTQIAYCTFDGGDEYYPRGESIVNKSLFRTLPRAMKKRPVWIFKGGSGLGKSTIASVYTNNTYAEEVFETDSVDKLPEKIYANVVVLGNRGGFTVDDVKSRLFGDPKVIIVNFEECE